MIEKLVSGGQTGADRAGLDLALEENIPHGGWCPRGRYAEDGSLPEVYRLEETPSRKTVQRTRWNVRDGDGTAIFSLAPDLTGGSKLTAEFADQYGKPWLHIWPERFDDPGAALREFVREHDIRTLNIAGPRASNAPEVYAWTRDVLRKAFFTA